MPSLNNKTFPLATLNLSTASSHEILSSLARSNVTLSESEDSQNACPWTFVEYDMAREALFYASLQVRKAFILESPYIKRNLFVYEAYNNGKYTIAEKQQMFPHLFNSLSVVIPVLSSTFASVGRFLKHAAGAMNWVVKKANILNVACTRAKYRIAFIGNINDWKNRRYFREFIPSFIDIINV